MKEIEKHNPDHKIRIDDKGEKEKRIARDDKVIRKLINEKNLRDNEPLNIIII